MRIDLKGDIAQLDHKLDKVEAMLRGEIRELRTDLTADIKHLDDRLFELGTEMKRRATQPQ